VTGFTLTEESTDFRLDLLMDETAKDKVWEKLATPLGTPLTPVTAASPSPAALLSEIKRTGLSTPRLELIKRLVVDMYEQGIEKSDHTDPNTQRADSLLEDFATRVVNVLTVDNRQKMAKLGYTGSGYTSGSRPSSGSTRPSTPTPSRTGSGSTRPSTTTPSRTTPSTASSQNTLQIEKLQQEIDALSRLRGTNRKAFFEKVFSAGVTGLDQNKINLIAESSELASLASTPLPRRGVGTAVPAGVAVPAVRSALPNVEILPQSVTICSKTKPDEDILIIAVKKGATK